MGQVRTIDRSAMAASTAASVPRRTRSPMAQRPPNTSCACTAPIQRTRSAGLEKRWDAICCRTSRSRRIVDGVTHLPTASAAAAAPGPASTPRECTLDAPQAGQTRAPHMQILDGRTVLSATDLVGQTACAHLTSLECEVAEGLRARPHRRDPVLDVLSRRGQEREARFLDRQEAANRRVVRLHAERARSLADAYAAAEATRAAMAGGADVLYQATLFDGRWFGRADFLVRVEAPSALGAWSYEVADAKLSREVKGGAILQLCLYSELASALQQRTPDQIHVITGDGA